jgi:hypothetical protein
MGGRSTHGSSKPRRGAGHRGGVGSSNSRSGVTGGTPRTLTGELTLELVGTIMVDELAREIEAGGITEARADALVMRIAGRWFRALSA